MSNVDQAVPSTRISCEMDSNMSVTSRKMKLLENGKHHQLAAHGHGRRVSVLDRLFSALLLRARLSSSAPSRPASRDLVPAVPTPPRRGHLITISLAPRPISTLRVHRDCRHTETRGNHRRNREWGEPHRRLQRSSSGKWPLWPLPRPKIRRLRTTRR